MHFNLALLKEHPYATGGIVIFGGVVVFYLLSSSSSSSGSGGNSDFAAELQADEQQQQVQAAENVQQSQYNAQLQQTQIEAQVANTQTAASLDANNVNTAAQLASSLAGINASVSENATNQNATTTQEANQLIETQNTTSMQDAVLESQINSGVVENANNNATALAGLENTNQYTYSLGSQSLNDATTLATQQNNQYANEVSYIEGAAGQQKNSALDATDQTALFQTILSGGNPAVAASGNSSTTSATLAGDKQGTALVGSITSGLSSVLAGLLG